MPIKKEQLCHWQQQHFSLPGNVSIPEPHLELEKHKKRFQNLILRGKQKNMRSTTADADKCGCAVYCISRHG